MSNLNKYGEIENAGCPHCGKAIKADWVACPECGHVLATKCPDCGRLMKAEWRTCPLCGDKSSGDSLAKPVCLRCGQRTDSGAVYHCPDCRGDVHTYCSTVGRRVGKGRSFSVLSECEVHCPRCGKLLGTRQDCVEPRR